MNKILILLDVDETIVDTRYEMNVEASLFRTAVDAAKQRGALIGLNSDTAMVNLRRRAQLYGADGPLVAERGALVAESPQSTPIITIENYEVFDRLRRAFVSTLISGGRLTRFLTITGDINTIEGGLPPIKEDLDLARIAVLVNGLKQCSFSFFVRAWMDSAWDRCNEPALDEVIDILRDICTAMGFPLDDYEIDRNPAYGICAVHHPKTQKILAVEPLLKLTGADEVLMVGNSMSDFMDDPRVMHFAVGNADELFKECASYVAQADRTAGVIEILDHIMD